VAPNRIGKTEDFVASKAARIAGGPYSSSPGGSIKSFEVAMARASTDVSARLIEMRDLAQVMAHMHGREPLDLTGQPDPDLQ
jgi:hypothetical protein